MEASDGPAQAGRSSKRPAEQEGPPQLQVEQQANPQRACRRGSRRALGTVRRGQGAQARLKQASAGCPLALCRALKGLLYREGGGSSPPLPWARTRSFAGQAKRGFLSSVRERKRRQEQQQQGRSRPVKITGLYKGCPGSPRSLARSCTEEKAAQRWLQAKAAAAEGRAAGQVPGEGARPARLPACVLLRGEGAGAWAAALEHPGSRRQSMVCSKLSNTTFQSRPSQPLIHTSTNSSREQAGQGRCCQLHH
ncbi:uncharacterized protein LOC133372797 [Rhineura floridana]|uniref:uncharacterized protein LOC133372797 n=1 Tax=Rhineura floridana TaxID=261503 RepID=UPI002AC88B10|nr:uncharacterized protein LOC133372797 [Rhineura floridana]